ncbi:MAG: hypothetical protein ACRDV4_01260 [Acidimicrobiales bacterium]
MHKTSLRLVRALVVAGLAVAGYFWLIPTSHADGKLLGTLLIDHTAAPAVPSKAAVSQSIPPSRSTFSVLKKAAKSEPLQSGLYERAWYVSASAPPETGLLLLYLPDVPGARTALSDGFKQLAATPQFSNETASDRKEFTVASVPGSKAESYALTDKSTGKLAGYSYSFGFRVGRAVISELMVTSGTKPVRAAAVADAQAEHRLLERKEAGFSLSTRQLPVVASVVYIVVAAAVVAGALFVPEQAVVAVRRRRERHEAKERERVQSQYRARGRRAVKRHRAPAWRQGARR